MPERRPRQPSGDQGLNVFYGRSHALQGVDLTLEHGVLSLVGRNGMGKTTLCKAIVGLLPVASGSIRFMGEELVGRTPAEIAQIGLGYVPQGRRLWPSLTVEEHLRLAAGNGRSRWTIARIYETFPRLAERRNNRGNQLSGGEQQMLAISRALLLNPHLAGHGRADRGPRAGDRRAGRGDSDLGSATRPISASLSSSRISASPPRSPKKSRS